jgi:RNA polymerase-binding transcription factor DksA
MRTTNTRFRERLLARRRELLLRYYDTLALADEEQTHERELVDAANEQWDLRVLSAMSDADASALEGVLAALHRLETGSYGTCADCGGRIEPERLHILPEAAFCYECAEYAEQQPPRWVAQIGR